MIAVHSIVKELLTEKTRLFLTILAVAWGTISIAIMLAVGEGLRLNFSKAMAGSGTNVLIVQGGQTSLASKGQTINQKVQLTLQDFQTLELGMPNIQITPEYTLYIPISYQDRTHNAQVSGVDPIYGELRYIQANAGGRFINELDNQERRQVIVLGNEVVKVLFNPGENPVGKMVVLNNHSFKVIGVMQNKLQMWNYQAPDNYLSWIPANTHTMLAAPEKIDTFVIVPNDPDQLSAIKTNIRNVIAQNHHLDPQDKSIITLQDSHESQEKTNALFRGMEIFLGIVGALTLVIAGVGVANVMFISVRRATRDIGIRMAVGARRYQILCHYIFEALLTTAVGGLIGLLGAKIIIALINRIPMQGKFFQFIGKPTPVLSALVISTVIVILGLIGFLAGFFPAKKAANIDPAEALRHE